MTPHRRAFVAGALGLATVPTLAKATVPMTKFQVLEAVIAAWKKQDVEGVLAHVTDDIVWRNSGGFAPAIRGKAAMRRRWNRQTASLNRPSSAALAVMISCPFTALRTIRSCP